jgi:hypothetical protein
MSIQIGLASMLFLFLCGDIYLFIIKNPFAVLAIIASLVIGGLFYFLIASLPLRVVVTSNGLDILYINSKRLIIHWNEIEKIEVRHPDLLETMSNRPRPSSVMLMLARVNDWSDVKSIMVYSGDSCEEIANYLSKLKKHNKTEQNNTEIITH